MASPRSQATESLDIDAALARLPVIEQRTDVLLARLREHIDLAPGARVLDLGAAQGIHVVALRRLGYDAEGIEPWAEAIRTGQEVARRTGVQLTLTEGVAESLPFADQSFDLLLAISVMEHVDDPAAVCAEAARVLRPGGGFYFYTSSALCPHQHEIRRFPLFPWYPPPLKRRIMDWATVKRPHLVGHTSRPAYHWYTPWGTRRMLRAAGFSGVRERWQLKREEELQGWRRLPIRAAHHSAAVRRLIDLAVPESAFLAIR